MTLDVVVETNVDICFFFFSSRRRHTRLQGDWSSDVCSSDLILHERLMTEFAGGFAEWEEVSTERAHAAAVSAAEEQALRQVHERHRVARSPTNDPRKELRRAQRELEETEAAVAQLEAQVAKVVAALEDPALYTRPDGAARAHELGAKLETLKRELEAGLPGGAHATAEEGGAAR